MLRYINIGRALIFHVWMELRLHIKICTPAYAGLYLVVVLLAVLAVFLAVVRAVCAVRTIVWLILRLICSVLIVLLFILVVIIFRHIAFLLNHIGYADSMCEKLKNMQYQKWKIVEYIIEPLLQFMIVRTYVFILSVLFPKSFRNRSQLDKTKPLIKMPCMNISRNDSIELQYPEPVLFPLDKAVQHQSFANMHPPSFWADRITCIAYMPTSSHIVGMQNIQSENTAVTGLFRNPAISLRGEKRSPRSFIQRLFLREGNPLLYHFIPNPDHLRQILFFICSYHNIHFSHLFRKYRTR